MTTKVPALDPSNIELFTDLYELSMMQGYFETGHNREATFSLFIRRLPAKRNYLLACGLDDVLSYLEGLSFSEESIAYLRGLGQFSERFLAWLAAFRFTGSVDAMPEGTPLFANEPILEITAPLAEAQLVETFVMNQVHVQTLLASKAARVVEAAAGRTVADFGARRTHGIDAANKAVRAFAIAGVASTSNVLASKLYGVPPSGTMAHSFIQSYDHEIEAFRDITRLYPETVLLVDTYDTLSGVDNVIALARELGDAFRVRAIRLDSGDLVDLACKARERLDAAGLQRVGILLSSSLDEYKIADILAAGAPVQGFGVGTSMGVSEDVPCIDIVYKLCAYEGKGRVKLSTGKPVLPGRKQVFRVERDGEAVGDVIGRADEALEGRPLLEPVMRDGVRLPAGTVTLDAARTRAEDEVGRLPGRIRALAPADPGYQVTVSEALARDRDRINESVAREAPKGG